MPRHSLTTNSDITSIAAGSGYTRATKINGPRVALGDPSSTMSHASTTNTCEQNISSHDEPTAGTTTINHDTEGHGTTPTSSIISPSTPAAKECYDSDWDGSSNTSNEYNHRDKKTGVTKDYYGTAAIQSKVALGDPRFSMTHAIDNSSIKANTILHGETAAITTEHYPQGYSPKQHKSSSSTPASRQITILPGETVAISTEHHPQGYNSKQKSSLSTPAIRQSHDNNNNSINDNFSAVVLQQPPQLRKHSQSDEWTTAWNEHYQSSLIKLPPRTSRRIGCSTFPSLLPPLINISCHKVADVVVSRETTSSSAKRSHQRRQTINIKESPPKKQRKNRYDDSTNGDEDEDDDDSWQTEFHACRAPKMVTSAPSSDGEQHQMEQYWNESFGDLANYTESVASSLMMQQRGRLKRRQEGQPSTTPRAQMNQVDDKDYEWTNNNSTRHEKLWDQNYGLLKEYYAHHGHCNVRVPPSHAQSPLSDLTRWIKTQRKQYKRKKCFGKPSSLTEEQIDKLNRLRFEWKVANDSWRERYDELRRYYREMGDCLVPTGYKENPRLAKWVAKQRQQYVLLKQNKPTQLTLSRLNLLRDLNFVWSPMAVNAQRNDHSWDQRYEELTRFKEEHGHCLVKVKNNKVNQPLGTWVRTQRYQYKLLTSGKKSRMTAERVRKLEELGFQWDAATTGGVMSWEERYEELAAYAKEMGDTMVPSTYPKNQNLSDWVKAQRHQYKLLKKGEQTRLTPERMKRLDEIQFDSHPVENGTTRYEKSWERNYNELKAYKEIHGDCLVKVKNNLLYPHLGRWVRTQRYQYKQLKEGRRSSMTPQRVEKLNQLGFVWVVASSSWEERYFELKRFYDDAAAQKGEQTGSATAAAATKDNGGYMSKKTGVPEKLDENPRLDKNPQLADWVVAQRHQYQLRLEKKPSQMTPRRIRLLEDINFRWQQQSSSPLSPSPHTTYTSWELYYRELKRFKERHGHCDVTSSSLSASSSSHSMGNENEYIIKSLERWIKGQRYNYHLFKNGISCEMTQDKMNRLEQIGFQWTEAVKGVEAGVPTMMSTALHHHHHPRDLRSIVNLGSLVLPPPGHHLVATAQPLPMDGSDGRHHYRHFHHHQACSTPVPHMTVDYPVRYYNYHDHHFPDVANNIQRRQATTAVPPSSMRGSPWQNPPWPHAAAQGMDPLYHAHQNHMAAAAESHKMYPTPQDNSHWQMDWNPEDDDTAIICGDPANFNYAYQQQQQQLLQQQQLAMSIPSPSPQQPLHITKTVPTPDTSPKDADDHKSVDEWQARYEELKDFKEMNGHCFVSEEDNPALKEWIYEARLEYQKFMDGTNNDDPSSLTERQIRQLEELGITDDTPQTPRQKGDDDRSSTTTTPTAKKKRKKAHLKISWKSKFDQLCQYKAEHGNTLVPNRYAPNPSLGVWVKTQRYQYHNLISGKKAKITTERIQLLNDIGFVWRLKDNPSPASSSTTNPTDQPEEEQQQQQPVRDPQHHWQTKLKHLIEFKKQNHHLLVPNRHPLIGTWVKNLRHQYSKLLAGKPSSLTPDRIQTLDELGFVWRVSDHGGTWMRKYFELVKFIKRRDGRRPKIGRVEDDDELDDDDNEFEEEEEMNEQLTKWVSYQRYQYKQFLKGKENQLTDEKKKMLEALGLFKEETDKGGIVVGGGVYWALEEGKDNSWMRRCLELKDYKMKNKDCLVPLDYTRGSKGLGEWVALQRKEYRQFLKGQPSTLTETRINTLKKIGFDFHHFDMGENLNNQIDSSTFDFSTQKGNQWKANFNNLLRFKNEHGHCLVPSRYSVDLKLGIWVKTQRHQYRKLKLGESSCLTDERIRALDEIGFVWSVRTTSDTSGNTHGGGDGGSSINSKKDSSGENDDRATAANGSATSSIRNNDDDDDDNVSDTFSV